MIDVYRSRLALLEHDDTLVDALRRSEAWGALFASGDWRRTYGRFQPSRLSYATLVFERRSPGQALVTVSVADASGGEAMSARGDVDVPELGRVAVSVFPCDSGLSTLAAAVNAAGEPAVVRYRPGRRCTFRVNDARGARYGKVFPNASGARVHEAGLALWRARGGLGFDVAEPLGWDAKRRVVWQREVAGVPPLGELCKPAGPALARRLGAAAGTLPSAPLRPTRTLDASAHCARVAASVRELGARVPALAGAAQDLGETLCAVHRRRPGRARPIHGAPHVSQWLQAGDRVALVDFDRLSLGNPEHDVAAFLGELDFEDGIPSPGALARNFVDGYEGSGGGLDDVLLAAYLSYAGLAKALRSARALRADGDRRAARQLAAAHAALSTARGAA